MSAKSANGSRRSGKSEEAPSVSHKNEKTPEGKKRKLHKTYIKGWKEDIAKNGFARCIMASCSFTSPDISVIQEHHKTCFSVFSEEKVPENELNHCEDELGIMQRFNVLKVTEESLKIWDEEIKASGQAFCGNEDCNFVGMDLPDLKNHAKYCTGVPNFNSLCCIYCRCSFSSKEIHLTHEQNCSKTGLNSKKGETLHFRVIKQMKNKEPSEEHIIQPGPDLPIGQYTRRRAYRAEHKKSWALTLEKYKYVKCIYQNCFFIAMSLEDMISHFGYCNGDGSFAKFVCPYCKGRVTSEDILTKHIERSHGLEKAINEKPMKEKADLNKFLKIKSPVDEVKCIVTKQSARRRLWEEQIAEFGQGYCRKSLCNFMATKIQELEFHSRFCDGAPNFDLYNCVKCRYRFPSKEDVTRHVPFCNDKELNYFSSFKNPSKNSQSESSEKDEFEIGPVFRQYPSKRPKIYTRKQKSIELVDVNEIEIAEEKTKQKSRGKPSKKSIEDVKNQEEHVKCGKCGFQGTKNSFMYHNLKTHVGLGWLEGEEPVDLNDEKLVIRLVKEAFRLNKKGACEKCDDVKRSVMGFVSHIQNCGKSEEEKDALKIACPHCDGKYLKYSLSSHIKLCNPSPEEEDEEEEEEEEEKEKEKEEEEEEEEEEKVEKEEKEEKEKKKKKKKKKKKVDEEEEKNVIQTPGKRRSAIRAVSKFQQVFNDNDEVEPSQKTHYFLYERGSERTPKLNSKLNNLWYKLKRENKKIPCRHANCKTLSSDVKEAKNHHYNCPELPERVYMCELCDFYSVDESDLKSHLITHRKYLRQAKTKAEEEIKLDGNFTVHDNEEEDDEGEEEEESKSSEDELFDSDEPRKRKKKGDDKIRKKRRLSNDVLKPDSDIELRLKQNFCRKEKINNVRGIQFYSNGLNMTLQEEKSDLKESETWPELHTTREDWLEVPPPEAATYFPQLDRSVSVRFGNEDNWRRFERFNSDVIDGIPVMFTGGSVRSMSWCKISFKRMLEKTQRQYLAVTTARKLDHLKDVYDRSSINKSSLLQIWDCGALDNDIAKDTPKLALGIVQEGGEIWDLAWFPNDTYAEATDQRMRRLGLLATASEDGAVRVWSVCDPSQLGNTEGPPVYATNPVVMLIADEDVEESCLQLSIGPHGTLAGGFTNGTVAVWNLKNISSPFCKKLAKCKLLRAHFVFQPHKTAITALTFCPSNSRYISTAGLDKFVKVWDLESPSVPVEQFSKDYSLDNIWTRNWPLLIYNFDEIMINFNKGAVKFIKDIFTDRHQSTFSMEDTCLSISFSDWLNALCGGSITGEVKLRLLKNLIHDQKRSQSIISSLGLKKLQNEDVKTEGKRKVYKQFPKSYDDMDSKFGLVFNDNLGIDKGKPKKPEARPEEFPIRAVNKIAFNPNFKSFTHIALGYNCGLIRINQVRELQTAKSLKFFLEKTRREKL